MLARRGVPLLFATGYSEAPQGHRGTPALSKPFTERALAAALGAMLGGPRAAPAA
jgi:hypothetical protein